MERKLQRKAGSPGVQVGFVTSSLLERISFQAEDEGDSTDTKLLAVHTRGYGVIPKST